MKLILEDGRGHRDATSYASAEFADKFLGEGWADADAKSAALIAGSEYIDLRWGSKLKGRTKFSSQAMQFPRLGLVDRNGRISVGVPLAIQQAACLYAVKHIEGKLYPSERLVEPKEVKTRTVTVGPIKTSRTFESGQANRFQSFPRADEKVRQFTRGGAGPRVIRG